MNIRRIAYQTFFVAILVGAVQHAMAASPSDAVKASLNNYIEAWREPDAQKRERLLETAWAENGTYTDPTAHVDGRKALTAHIEGFLTNPMFKGYSIVMASEIDIHHHVFRFEWTMKDSSGKEVTGGMDYGEFNNDGAITKIVGFFGPFPELK